MNETLREDLAKEDPREVAHSLETSKAQISCASAKTGQRLCVRIRDSTRICYGYCHEI